MTNQKPTPGPWRATVTHGEGRSVIAVMAEGPTQVAVITEGGFDDARLIAATPDLLEALGALLERVRCYEAWLSNRLIASRPLTGDEKEILQDIRQSAPEAEAAIRKAKGDE